MNYNETLTFIHSLGKFSLPASLERMTLLMEELGNPQNEFKSVHIAGTNGKGSVCVMTAAAFTAAGYKTGLFISPYIINFRERISVDGEYISEEKLCELCDRVRAAGVNVTEFEFITAVGFLYFKECGCDVAVIETGMGGRFDATNVIRKPLACAITKIGLDHTGILGNTLGEIAAEKCGIIKECPTVTCASQQKETLEVIEKNANVLCIPDLSQLKVISSDIGGNCFWYKGYEYETSLIGEFQIENALTAIELVRASGLNVSQTALCKGLSSAFIPARLEVISKDPTVILDGAHNPDGAQRLGEFLKGYSGKITAIIGVMKDKDYKAVLAETLPYCDKVITVKVADMPRALDNESLCDIARQFCKETVKADSYSQAIELAVQNRFDLLAVFGSLYLASGIRDTLKNSKYLFSTL